MKRLAVCIAIAAAAIIMGIASAVYTNHASKKLSAIAREIKNSQSHEQSVKSTEEFCLYWDKTYKVLACIENSGELNNIAAEVGRIRAYAEHDSEELPASLDCICGQAELLARRQTPSFYSVAFLYDFGIMLARQYGDGLASWLSILNNSLY